MAGAEIRVALLSGERLEQSGENGRFSLVLPAGKYAVQVRAAGFNPQSKQVDLKPGHDLELEFRLDPEDYEAEPVRVQAMGGRLPDPVYRMVNAAPMPTPTAFEKKAAPVVYKASWIFMLTVWTLIALSALGVTQK